MNDIFWKIRKKDISGKKKSKKRFFFSKIHPKLLIFLNNSFGMMHGEEKKEKEGKMGEGRRCGCLYFVVKPLQLNRLSSRSNSTDNLFR